MTDSPSLSLRDREAAKRQSGGMAQRALHEMLDAALGGMAEMGYPCVTISEYVMRDAWRPMSGVEVAILRLAEAMNDLRNADDYFTFEGHLGMAAKRWGVMWRLDQEQRCVVFINDPKKAEAAKARRRNKRIEYFTECGFPVECIYLKEPADGWDDWGVAPKCLSIQREMSHA